MAEVRGEVQVPSLDTYSDFSSSGLQIIGIVTSLKDVLPLSCGSWL